MVKLTVSNQRTEGFVLQPIETFMQNIIEAPEPRVGPESQLIGSDYTSIGRLLILFTYVRRLALAAMMVWLGPSM